MTEQKWIGIQFNFDGDVTLKPWVEKRSMAGIETNGQHLTIKFSNEELQNLKNDTSGKIKILKEALEQFLDKSDYTNIYAYLNADEMAGQKSQLLAGEFAKPKRVEEVKDKKMMLKNYIPIIKTQKVLEIIENDGMFLTLNDIFEFVGNRDFATSQTLSLELGYEDKEEWGTDRDCFNVSIQLEK